MAAGGRYRGFISYSQKDKAWGKRLHGWLARFMYWLIGVMAPHGRTPRDLLATFRGHHEQLRPVIDWMIACDPERIVIAHGKWFETGGAAELRRAFDWVKG